MTAFLIPNEKSIKPLQTYVASVGSGESLTGIDFFYVLPDSNEKRLKSSKDLSGWNLINNL